MASGIQVDLNVFGSLSRLAGRHQHLKVYQLAHQPQIKVDAALLRDYGESLFSRTAIRI